MMANMDKLKAILALVLGAGLIATLLLVVVVDVIVSVAENKGLDPEITQLLQQALTGLIGLLSGFLVSKTTKKE